MPHPAPARPKVPVRRSLESSGGSSRSTAASGISAPGECGVRQRDSATCIQEIYQQEKGGDGQMGRGLLRPRSQSGFGLVATTQTRFDGDALGQPARYRMMLVTARHEW